MKKIDLLEGQEYIIRSVQEYYDNCFIGEEKWLVISELSQEEIQRQYKTELKAYEPWMYLSLDQFAVIIDSERNEEKHRCRNKHNVYYDAAPRLLDVLLRDEGNFLPEEDGCLDPNMIPGIEKLTEKQFKRMVKHDLEGYSYKELGKLEGVTKGAIGLTVEKAHRTIIEEWSKKYNESLETKERKGNG